MFVLLSKDSGGGTLSRNEQVEHIEHHNQLVPWSAPNWRHPLYTTQLKAYRWRGRISRWRDRIFGAPRSTMGRRLVPILCGTLYINWLTIPKGYFDMIENQEYAGFWIRVAAALIDTVIFLLVFSIPLTALYGSEYWVSEQMLQGFWDILITYIIPIFITVWFWLKYLGTPGKMALRLRVVDAQTGQALTTPQAIGRYLGYYVSAFALMLGFIWVGIDKKKQGFHDKLAGTVVVRDIAKEPVQFDRG